MPWPPRQPTRDTVSPDDLQAYDTVVDRARRRGASNAETDAGYYGRLMLSPDLGNRLSEVGAAVRKLGDRTDTYSHADREFVDQVLSADFKTNIVQSMHINDAVSTGVRIEAIEALRAGREDLLTDDERQLADFIRRVAGGQVDAPSWDKMEARMGARGVLDYTIFILFLQLTMRLMSAVGMPSPSDDEIDTLITELKAGQRDVDDYRKRIS